MPSIIDVADFKETLAIVLQLRSQSRLHPQDLPPKCTPAWFGVLFGILACGVQLASSESRSETMKARVFGNYSSPKEHATLECRLITFSLD